MYDAIAITNTMYQCKKCRREWGKRAGDVVWPPEKCPFCRLAEVNQTPTHSSCLEVDEHVERLTNRCEALRIESNRLYGIGQDYDAENRKLRDTIRSAARLLDEVLRDGI